MTFRIPPARPNSYFYDEPARGPSASLTREPAPNLTAPTQDVFEPGTTQKSSTPSLAPPAAPPSSWRLDRSFAHTKATAALPVFTPETDTALVRVPANGQEFRARVYGMQNKGPALVLLHGFPASSIMWDELAQKAADKGYRVLAYDQRGTSPGARPSGKEAYEVKNFIDDLDGVTKAVGFDDFHLVGHDVGAVVAWGGAMAFPERVKSLETMSIPNPEVLEIRPYVKLFSIPALPEAFLRVNKSKRFQKLLPQNRSAAEEAEYAQIFREPGSLSSNLNFYRGVSASVDYLKESLGKPIEVPTRFTYGAGEGWVNPEYLQAQQARMSPGVSLEVTKVEDAGDTGHFLIENQPAVIIDGILSHIASHQ